MSDDWEDESIGEELEYGSDSNDEENEYEDDYFVEPDFEPEPIILSPIIKKEENRNMNGNAYNSSKPILNSNTQAATNNTTLSVNEEYSMDFSVVDGNETGYSDDGFETTGNNTTLFKSTKDNGTIAVMPSTGNNQASVNTANISSLVTTNSADSARVVPTQTYQTISNTQPPIHTSTAMPQAIQNVAAISTMSIQALEAEAAVEQMSREVIKLRNQHRQILQQRRAAIDNKKARAEERRLKYKEELVGFEKRIQELNLVKTTLEEKIDFINLENQHLNNSKVTLNENISRLNKIITEQKETIENAESTNKELKSLNECQHNEWKQKEQTWNVEKEELLLSMKKQQIRLDIAMKSVEVSEQRLNKERECLPEFFQKRVDSECERLKELQALAEKKEISLKLQEENQKSSFEHMRTELFEEIHKTRNDMLFGMEQQRLQLEQAKKEFDSQKYQFELNCISEKSEISAMKISVQQQKQELTTQANELQQKQHEFDIAVHMVGPNLALIENEKKEVVEKKKQADRLLTSLTNQAKDLEDVEQHLILRELDCKKVNEDCKQLTKRFHLKEHDIHSKEQELLTLKKNIERDRFKLYQCMMEMSNQMCIIKDGIKHMHTIRNNGKSYGNANMGMDGSNDPSATNCGKNDSANTASYINADPNIIALLQSLESVQYSMNRMLETHMNSINTSQHKHLPPPVPVNQSNDEPTLNLMNSSFNDQNGGSAIANAPYNLAAECASINKQLGILNSKHESATSKSVQRLASHHTPEVKHDQHLLLNSNNEVETKSDAPLGATLHQQYQHSLKKSYPNHQSIEVIDTGLCINSVMDDITSSHSMLWSIASKYN